MVKQFMKMAGVKTQKEFMKKFPTEESFFKAHPEAKMLADSMMYGGSYAKGGGIDNPGFKALPEYVQHKIISNMAYGGYYQEGGEEMMQQQQGAASQQEQVIQFIVQSLQQGMAPEEIMGQLVQAGIPEQQAAQLVQAVMQRMQQMQQAGPQPGQMPAEQGMPQEAAPEGMMKKGGSYSGTYYQGSYFKHGGMHKKYKKGGEYDMSEQEVQDLLNKGYKIQYL